MRISVALMQTLHFLNLNFSEILLKKFKEGKYKRFNSLERSLAQAKFFIINTLLQISAFDLRAISSSKIKRVFLLHLIFLL